MLKLHRVGVKDHDKVPERLPVAVDGIGQKVTIAMAIAVKTKTLLIADEPISAMEPQHRYRVLRLLDKMNG